MANARIKLPNWLDSNALRLFLCGLAVLYWELVLIRWLGTTIRIVAYFSNLVLISSFFGLGTGALLTRFSVKLERFIVPLIAFVIISSIWLGRLWHANPNGENDFIWIGSPLGIANIGIHVGKLVSVTLVLIMVYSLTATVFAAFGQFLGNLFKTHPPLRAYSIEVTGSLAGITLFALFSFVQTTPTVWVGVGIVLMLLVLPWQFLDTVFTLLLGITLVIAIHSESQRYIWSPYYRILVEPITRLTQRNTTLSEDFQKPVGYVLAVNNDYHQMMLDLRPHIQEHPFLLGWRFFYNAPYQYYEGLGNLPPGPILIVGAGTGNDVAAALRQTDRDITAVEIDPAITKVGRTLHAEQPYANPRVTLVIDDARAFFQRGSSGHYAAVIFGFLDSHRLLSAFSSVRLDNFIYTHEAMQEVRRLLIPGGRVAVSFASNTPWIHERIIALLNDVFDFHTLLVWDKSLYANGILYLNGRTFFEAEKATKPKLGVLIPTDDWPFLYLRKNAIPGHNMIFLLLAILLSTSALFILPRGERHIRLSYFFLGAAFFLLETSNVIRMALLYGSTWWVNTIVFTGILVLILLSNITATFWKIPINICIALLSLGILLAVMMPLELLLGINPMMRAIVAIAVFLSPIYFGGLIFAQLIKNENHLFKAYGSNVLGAVLGGSVEYLSLVMGFRFLLAVVLLFYLIVFLIVRRSANPITAN